jgi:hypothetical protein
MFGNVSKHCLENMNRMLMNLNAGSSQHGKHRRASAASNCVTAMFLDSPLYTYVLKKIQPEFNKMSGHFISKNSKIMHIWYYNILHTLYSYIKQDLQCSLELRVNSPGSSLGCRTSRAHLATYFGRGACFSGLKNFGRAWPSPIIYFNYFYTYCMIGSNPHLIFRNSN